MNRNDVRFFISIFIQIPSSMAFYKFVRGSRSYLWFLHQINFIKCLFGCRVSLWLSKFNIKPSIISDSFFDLILSFVKNVGFTGCSFNTLGIIINYKFLRKNQLRTVDTFQSVIIRLFKYTSDKRKD